MTRITEGHLVRHYQGVKGGRDAALLDIAQDHALFHLNELGLFRKGLVFKGGTALRKFRSGNSGRFSTDLDFATSDPELAIEVLAALDGTEVGGFTFGILTPDDNGRRAVLSVSTPFGTPRLGAKIEIARHAPTLEPEVRDSVRLPIHALYDFEPVALPVVRAEEAIAEKLARFGRVPLARDLYDLYWYAKAGAFDEALVRRLWILKTYRDIVVDGRGGPPIDPEALLEAWPASEFHPEDIGYLTKPVKLEEWLRVVRARYGFLKELDSAEQRLVDANARHLPEVTEALSSAGHIRF